MRTLFWFEHLNGVRIVGELLVWIWAFGHVAPSRVERDFIFDVATWGSTVSVAAEAAQRLSTDTAPLATTTFDLKILVALPLAIVFVITRSNRADLARLVILSLASGLMYSRTSIV